MIVCASLPPVVDFRLEIGRRGSAGSVGTDRLLAGVMASCESRSVARRHHLAGHLPDVCVRPPCLQGDPPLAEGHLLDRRGGDQHDPAVEQARPHAQRRRLVGRRQRQAGSLDNRAHTAVPIVHRKSVTAVKPGNDPDSASLTGRCKLWSLTDSGSTTPPNTRRADHRPAQAPDRVLGPEPPVDHRARGQPHQEYHSRADTSPGDPSRRLAALPSTGASGGRVTRCATRRLHGMAAGGSL